MFKYACTNCQYMYVPSVGDEDQGIPPKVLFESLPENWCCPHCGENIDAFTPVQEYRYVVENPDDIISSEEEMHIPFFTELPDGKVVVTVGRDDNFHPDEPPHAIEFIGLFSWEDPIAGVFFPQTYSGDGILLDPEWEDWDSVVAACSLHGEWSVSRNFS